MLDPDIREALFSYLDENFGKHRTFEELPIGTSRADIAAVTDIGICGFEIKSDADSYARLSSQIKNYDKYFNFNYIVVGKRHKISAARHVPQWWGIFCVYRLKGQNFVELVRPHSQNPMFRIKFQLELLWKNELSAILSQLGMPRYPQKSKLFIRKKLLENVPEQKLLQLLCFQLFERDFTLL
ncbi:MAG: sce7726 family protein [Ruminococcus sp.]|jgi:hypothetical protein|nr:sce7726 family protein [Ruminococcus sp.]